MTENKDLPDFGTLAALMAATAGGSTIKSIIDACPEFIRELKQTHPLKVAATFGALLTQKKLQLNCLRLENLVHICIATGGGTRAPSSELLIRGYKSVGRACGYLEDPPEDIFVGNIHSKRGNYLVLEGIWESGTFFLQRFVNLVDNLPDSESHLKRITDSIHALLKISNFVCSKAKLHRNEMGNEGNMRTLPTSLASNSKNLRNIVSFSTAELQSEGIDLNLLAPFIFDPNHRKKLLDQSVGHSDLELRPFGFEDGTLYLLLPTAISATIRRFVIACLGTGPNRNLFLRQLGHEYSSTFKLTPLVGEGVGVVKFAHMPWGSVSGMSRELDEGHYLTLFFLMDTLEDFEEDGLIGINELNDECIQELTHGIEEMQTEISQQSGFKSGITVLISCGIGRGAIFSFDRDEIKGWRSIFLSAPDFCTLSNTPGMKPLNLWRIEDMKARLSDLNVEVQNVNGFLNLYAWAESLDGHLIPHAEIPEELSFENTLNFSIAQNSLVELRHKVVNIVDSHVEQFIDGSWIRVQTEGSSYFEEDNRQPLYVHLSLEPGLKLLGTFVTEQRCWWCELGTVTDGPDTRSFDRWKMLGAWIERAAPPLEKAFSHSLGKGPILWRCVFEYSHEPAQKQDNFEIYGTWQDAREAIQIGIYAELRTVELRIGEKFDNALFHPENIAEKELVRAFVTGIACLANTDNYDLEEIIQEIVPNAQARQTHMFPAKEFRDFIGDLHNHNPIFISRFDDAFCRLGMGWLARDPKSGGRIEGKENCLQFLNTLVQRLEDQLCQDLLQFNRTHLMTVLLHNYEIASVSRDRWHRTAAAILGLRRDKLSALKTMREHEHKINGVLQPSRILLEMAICESPVDDGALAGDLELSKLMAKVSQIFYFGGWSDLIYWDLMETTLIVRPLGDVHANLDFLEAVVAPFGNTSSEYRFKASVRGYATRLKAPKTIQETDKDIFGEFLDAWKAEFGVELDAYRRFIDAIENWGIEQQKAVFQISLTELVALADDADVGHSIVENLKLTPRPTWKTLSDGYTEKDIAPWRFRRRLSILRRPLLQVNTEENPLFLVAPGILREGFISMLTNYSAGAYPDWHLGNDMKRYAGHSRRRNGSEFNSDVAKRMSELGWQALPEVTLTKIIGTALDRNYGDVDVLAWSPDSGRVLIMECKDLQFRKTLGEIAEQLADFQGKTYDNGKGDLLKKHLDRVELLQANITAVRKFLQLGTHCQIESHIVFRHPVPMQFVDSPIRAHAKCHIFDDLQAL